MKLFILINLINTINCLTQSFSNYILNKYKHKLQFLTI